MPGSEHATGHLDWTVPNALIWIESHRFRLLSRYTRSWPLSFGKHGLQMWRIRLRGHSSRGQKVNRMRQRRDRHHGQMPRLSATLATRSMATARAEVRRSRQELSPSISSDAEFLDVARSFSHRSITASVARSILVCSFSVTSFRSHCSFSMFCTHSK